MVVTLRISTKSSLTSKEPISNSLSGGLKIKELEIKSVEKPQRYLTKSKTRASKVMQPKLMEGEDSFEIQPKSKKSTVLIKTKSKLLEDSDNEIPEIEIQEDTELSNVKESDNARFRLSRESHKTDTGGQVKKPEENDNSGIELDEEVLEESKVEEKIIEGKSEVIVSAVSKTSQPNNAPTDKLPLKEDVKMNESDNLKQNDNNKVKKDVISNKDAVNRKELTSSKECPSSEVKVLTNEKQENMKIVYESYEDFLVSMNNSTPKKLAKELVKEKIQEQKANEVNHKDVEQRKKIMKELKHKAKIKEVELNKELACKKIDKIYKKQLLKQFKEAINEVIKKKKIAGQKIVRAITKWYENIRKQLIVQMYVNHCASIIQQQYRLHLKRTKHTQSNKPKDNIKVEENIKENNARGSVSLAKDKGVMNDKPIKCLGKSSYDIEGAIAQDKEVEQPIKTVKKPFLRRKQVYDPQKAIKKSKKSSTAREEIRSEGRKESIKSFEEIVKSKKSFEELENSIDAREKSKRDYLKRKLKKVEAKKLDWQRVSHRIDCWNQKQEQKEILSKPLNKANQVKNSIDQPLEELKNMYLEYHNDQGRAIGLKEYFARDKKNSKIPVLSFSARFFKNYSNDIYEVNYILTIRMS
jgi:hypothetical protein